MEKERMDRSGFGMLFRRLVVGREEIGLSGLCAVKIPGGGRLSDPAEMELRIRGDERRTVRSRFGLRRGIAFVRGYRIHTFRLRIRFDHAEDLDIQNKIDFWFRGEPVCDVSYSPFVRWTGAFHHTRPVKREGKSLYFRQSISNRLWFVVRPQNLYDSFFQRVRVFAAWALAGMIRRPDPILMYEKESSRYEESASVVYEQLVDQGYRNVYYIINEDNPVIPSLPGRYRRQLIMKDSFRHLLYFFRCRRFIGTETVDHAMQLRAASRHIMAKTQSTEMTHVFLQHGVMYMVSLDADMRVGFVNRRVRQYRVVVSSEAEAMHFMLLGGFSREDIYITGLAKFDRSRRDADSDLIMIMPTWRRWETNLAGRAFTETGYYRMLDRIVCAVPKRLRDKIVIKPHPLMERMMEDGQTHLSQYLRPDMTHDEVLQRCRLLITDYSSIAYDAFYRGANVIFFWEEMEECMCHYGGAHLMINEYNAFGDICRNTAQLETVFDRNYNGLQRPEDIRRYRRIVEFSDGKNTERIIRKMKEDGII